MKKLVMGLLCMAMALTVPTSALAGELSVETQVDVKVKYTEEEAENSEALASENPIILPDGTKVTVQAGSDTDSEIRMVIVPVEKENADAYSYVEEMVSEYGKEPYAFYILFYLDGKETVPSAPVTVTVTVPEGYEESALYSFTGDGGKAEIVADEVKNGTWTFNVSESCYFAAVLPKGEQPTVTPEPTVTPTKEPEPTTTPKPSVTPTKEPEPTTTPEPTVTPTKEPDAATTPTATPKPTASPTITSGSNGSNSGTGTGGTGGTAQGSAAKTGDETDTTFWLLGLIGGAVCMVVMVRRRKRAS